MTIELNREAIAQVAALPAVTEAAEAGWRAIGAAADRSHADGQ